MVSTPKSGRMGWEVAASQVAKRTTNPIRAIVDTMKLVPHPDKAMIALSIGMHTAFEYLVIDCHRARMLDDLRFLTLPVRHCSHDMLTCNVAHSHCQPGDPTIFGNLHAPQAAVDAVIEQITGGRANGYPHAAGKKD